MRAGPFSPALSGGDARVSAPADGPAWSLGAPEKNDGVTAVLGPTNTGKTHYAIERMLGHPSGVIGFPLRLLAREVYDRIVAMRGPREIALITGEEKIVPPNARYYLCTVESMPLDWGADFLAVDEIQLCADAERGHVFTNRLLTARGRRETLFLGSNAMRDRIAALLPGVRFQHRERLSVLSFAGSKKISRMPARSAIVAFSVDSVYAIAELIRRQKGGAAVVMGALSPRTRNAQVALYQEGEVDYLVATDAIGMGLNLDVRHVAFAGLAKFDGRRHRRLEAGELAQIAGRAGRHMNDGTFGVTGEAPPLDEDMVGAIENHRFPPVGRLHWRNAALDYGTPENLIMSLERDPGSEHLTRAREADDVAALRLLSRDPELRARCAGRAGVKLLWEVCQVPDFRKTMPAEHASLLSQIFRHLSADAAALPEDWIAAQCARLDQTDGDIDALSKRLAYIRTWTYVANRARWLEDPGHWRERTREIEDKLSDALHARLTQRFVDRRTSVLARRLKQKEALVAVVDDKGDVTVEDHHVGRIEGFRFQPDPSAVGDEVKTLQAAGAQALQAELARRVNAFYGAADAEIALTEQGGLMWGDAAVGRLEATAGAGEGGDPMRVRASPFVDEMVEAALVEKIERRLQFWIDRKIETVFEPLLKLREDQAVQGLARGVAFQLVERMGVIPRQEVADQIKALDQDARRPLRAHQVRFGQHTVFIPALLKPAPTRLRLILWGLSDKLDEIPSPPPPGHVTIPADPEAPKRYYAMAGYHRAGPRAIRLDMLERLADLIRPLDARAGFEATPDMLSITGATLEQFAEMMEGLGYRAERGERPKAAKSPETTPETAAEPAAQGADAVVAPDLAATAIAEPDSAAAEKPAESAAAQNDAAQNDAGQNDAGQNDAVQDAAADQVASEQSAAQDADPAPTQDAADQEPAPAIASEPEIRISAEGAPEMAVAEASAEAPAAAAPQLAEEAAEPGPRSEAEAQPAAPGDPAPVDAALEQEASGADAQAAAEAEPAEMEVFYLFRSQPRGRRGRDAGARDGDGQGRRRPRRAEGQGPAQGQAAGEGQREGQREGGDGRGDRRGGKAKRQDGRQGERQDGRQDGRQEGRQEGRQDGRRSAEGKPDRGGKRGPRHQNDGKGGGRPREFAAGPDRGRREKRIDPDSPFAILQKLKDGE